MLLRPVRTSYLVQIRRLNESAIPHVNSIPLSDFEEFIRVASFFVVIEIENMIAAFLIVLGAGQNYESENYRYFSSKYKSFDYVDRIVVGDQFQGIGVGKALYQYLIDNSKEERITCEVNIEPPNPGSIQFHKSMDFIEVAQQNTEAGKKRVSLMSRERENNR